MNRILFFLYIQIEKLLWLFVKSKFAKCGSSTILPISRTVIGEKYISLGDRMFASHRFRIEAIDEYNGVKFSPKILIGNDVIFNTDIHIGCINYIEIGDNVMFASRIFITDHQHGDTSENMIGIIPAKRPLISKGPVVIKNSVWVGEGVTILPNVTIGENSIIGSNSVVTKSIPANCVAAGIPAKIIKIIN